MKHDNASMIWGWQARLMFIVLLCIPLYISFTAEWIYKQDAKQALDWVCHNSGYFMVGVLVVSGMFLVMLSVFNSVLAGFLTVFTIMLALSFSSYFKMSVRGEPLYALDLIMTREMLSAGGGGGLLWSNISGDSNPLRPDHLYFILISAFIVVIAIFCLRLQKIKLSLPHRLLVSSMGVAVVLSIYDSSFFNTNLWNDFTYEQKGFSLGFLSNIQYCLDEEAFSIGSPQYTEDYLNEMLFALKTKVPSFYENKAEKQPNVIVVMSESFYDITKLDRLRLSEEPIPNYRELIKKNVSGNMVSITFGGGTANVEYEFLTGFLNRYFNMPPSSYQTVLNKPVMSMASIFKDKGYETVALHTYEKSFYDRERVYPLLGFDKFIGFEDIPKPRLYDGFYLSDSVLTDMIIEEYENKSQPIFVFAISMENHQPYNEEKYTQNPIKVLNTDIGVELKDAVEAYLHGLHNADRELKRLVDYFSDVDEDTCILFFGDHLPSLGPEFELYRKMGAVEQRQGLMPEELLAVLSPQFLIWSNFQSDFDQKTQYVDAIGANFLGSYLLDYLRMKKPVFYHYVDTVYEELHYMSREDFVIGSDGQLYYEMPGEYREQDELYKLFQYDMLLGEGYITEGLNGYR